MTCDESREKEEKKIPISRREVVQRASSSLSGPVVLSCRALSRRLKFSVRRHKLKKDFLFRDVERGVGSEGRRGRDDGELRPWHYIYEGRMETIGNSNPKEVGCTRPRRKRTLRKSTPPQNRRLHILVSNSKQ